MAFTKVVGAGIHTLSNITSHNINSSGIITATKFVGPIEGDITAVDATFTGNVSIGGTLTYEDVKNVDSVGIGTFRQGIFIPDNKEAKFGNTAASPDFKIYSDGTNAIQYAQNNPLYIKGRSVYIQTNNNEASAYFIKNGGVKLYYDGSALPKFETTSSGVSIGGTTIITNASGGKLGVGTDNPTSNLQVDGTSLTLINKVDNNNTLIKVENTGPGNAGLRMKNSNAEFTFLATNNLRIMDEGAGGVERLTIASSSGNVGIRSTAPAHKLDVFGAIRSHQVTPSLYLQTTANTAQSAIIRFGDAGSFQRASIQYDFSGDNHLRFKMGGAGNNVERMTIVGTTGAVGINTATPIGDFTVLTAGNGYFGIDGGGGYGAEFNVYHRHTKANTFKFANNGGTNELVQQSIINTNGKFIWNIGGTAASNEKMRLDNAGRVGIGTANPSQMLTVRGTILKTRSDHGTGLIYLQNDGSQNGNIVINQNGGVTRVKLDSAGDSYFNGGKLLVNTTTAPTADLKLLVSGNGGVSSGSYFSFRGDYGNVPEPAAYAIKYDSSLTNLSGSGGLHQYAYGGIAFNLGGQKRVNFTSTGSVGIGSENPSGVLDLYHATNNTILNVKSGDAGSVINLIDNATRSSIEQNGATLKIISDTAGTYANSEIRFQVDGATKLLIDDDGIVTNTTTHPQIILEDSSGRKVSLRAPSSTNYAALGTDTVHQLVFYTAGYANKRGTIHNNGQVRFGDECMSDRTSFRHQFSSSAGSPDVLSLQNPSNSDGQGVNLGFWARNTNNAAIQIAQITGVADETQANSTQEGSLQIKTNGGATLSTRIDIDQTNTTLYNNVHMLKGGGSPDAFVVLQTHDTANAKASLRLLARDNSNVNETCKIQAYSDNTASVNLEFHTDTGEHLRLTRNGQLWLYAAGGDNQFNSKRTSATDSNGNYFFHLQAINNVDQTVGILGFHRHSGNDDARFVLHTKKSGDDLEERMRIHADGTVQFSATGGSAQTSADNRQLFEIGSVGGIKLGNYGDQRRATPADASTITGLRAPNILDWGRDRGDPTLQAGDSISNFSGTWVSYTLNGTGTGNKWKLGQGPHGGMEWLWSGKSAYTDASQQAQGGWNTSFDVDPNYTYMFITYVKRVSSTADGNWYVGTGGVAALGSGSTSGLSNPYWTCGSTNNLDRNIWHVAVHYVRSYHSSNTNKLPNAGTYRMSDGSRIADGANCNIGNGAKFNTTSTGHSCVYRSYLFYASTNNGTELHWAQPHAYKCDGTEPTLMEILGRELANNDDTDNWDG